MVFVEGISLIPNIGIHTQKIPPTTSVKDKRVNSAAGIVFDPVEYKIKPKQTIVPWAANRPWFLLVDKKFKSFWIITIKENTKQKIPAKATVVNFGVSFLHLKETEKTENPNDDSNPNNNPIKELLLVSPNAISVIPVAAIIIAIQTFVDIFSFKNKKPSKAVITGIAAKQSKVTAAVVLVIDHINVIMATPNPILPNKPDQPIWK